MESTGIPVLFHLRKCEDEHASYQYRIAESGPVRMFDSGGAGWWEWRSISGVIYQSLILLGGVDNAETD